MTPPAPQSRARRALPVADVLAAAGVIFLVIGFGLAWLPAGLIVLGAALLFVARYGTEA